MHDKLDGMPCVLEWFCVVFNSVWIQKYSFLLNMAFKIYIFQSTLIECEFIKKRGVEADEEFDNWQGGAKALKVLGSNIKTAGQKKWVGLKGGQKA